MSRRSKLRKVLLQHPDVVQAYVVGVPDQAKGEIVGAAVELRAGAITDTASIIALCRERLASYKVPIQLAFRTAQLPVSSTLSGHSASVEIENSNKLWPAGPVDGRWPDSPSFYVTACRNLDGQQLSMLG